MPLMHRFLPSVLFCVQKPEKRGRIADIGGIRLKNQRFFNRQICADTQIRELSAAWRISVKKNISRS